MKNKNLFTVAVLASVMMFSCSKEDLTNEMKATPSKTENFKSPEELAKDLMQKSYADFSKLSKEEYFVKLTAAKEMQSLSTDPKSNSISSGSETPLEDVFYIQEGMFNNEFGDILSENEALKRVEKTYTVSVHKDSQENYFMYSTDLTTFYNDLAAELGFELDPSNNEIMVICDLNLESIDDENGSAIIRAGISIAIQLPLPRIPTTSFWAANQLGTCSQSIGNLDASDYIQGHLNGKVRTSINLCEQPNTGYTAYPTVWKIWASHLMTYAPSQADYFANTYPYFWKDNNNQCLGNTAQEWYNLYSTADALNGIGLSYAQNALGGSFGNLELIYTNYSSHDNGNIQFGFPSNHTLYHGGSFEYGVVYCN